MGSSTKVGTAPSIFRGDVGRGSSDPSINLAEQYEDYAGRYFEFVRWRGEGRQCAPSDGFDKRRASHLI
jgi:hypothetical protein